MKFVNKQTVMAVVIIFVMVFSALGYMLGREDERTLTYNKQKFTIRTEGVFTNINGEKVRFDYFPSDVENINVSNETVSKLTSTRMIYSTSNYSDANNEAIAQISFELNKILKEQFSIYLETGFLNEEGKKPVNCSTATQYIPVIIFEIGETGVTMQDNCITAKAADARDFVRVKDRLLYGMLGVI